MSSNYDDDYSAADQDDGPMEPEDDTTPRLVWEITSWILVVLTLVLNLVVIVVLLVRRNAYTVTNKGTKLVFKQFL